MGLGVQLSLFFHEQLVNKSIKRLDQHGVEELFID
jgi:hypothetical protein